MKWGEEEGRKHLLLLGGSGASRHFNGISESKIVSSTIHGGSVPIFV